MPRCSATAFCRSGPMPDSVVTGIFASWVSRRGATAGPGSLDAEQVGVERLPAVVDLGRHTGPVLLEPLGDAARVAGRRPLTLDDRDDLVLVADDRVEQLDGRLGHRRRDRPDAVAADAHEVTLTDGTQLAGRVAHGPGDLAGDHVPGELRHLLRVLVGLGLGVVRHE